MNAASLTKTTFDCSGESNAIADAPADITCAGASCSGTDCCTGAAQVSIPTIDVGFTGQTVEACVGDRVRVTWNGNHSIQETETASCTSTELEKIEDYYPSGHIATYSNIFAQPGETRYFKCNKHCFSNRKFSVSCPLVLYKKANGTFVKAACSEIEQAYDEKECASSCS